MKILIADDEDYTREGIMEAIDWEDYGITEVMQATNGSEAQKIAQWFCPDIILTDIRMPKMDGIAFATEVLKGNPDCRIIFISGYMEIDYYKSAIKMSAIDYIEKPIDIKLLKDAIKKAIEQVENRKKNEIASKVSETYRQQMLFHLLVNKDSEEKILQRKAHEVDFPISGAFVCIAFLYKNDLNKSTIEDVYIPKWEEILREYAIAGVWNVNQEKRQIEFVLSYQDKKEYRLMSLYNQMLMVDDSLRLGIGIETDNIHYIYNSYKTANVAVNCAFYNTEQRIYQIDEDIIEKNFVEPSLYNEFTTIMSENMMGLRGWFDSLFEQLLQNKYYQREQIYSLVTSLVVVLFKNNNCLYDVITEIKKEEQLQTYIKNLDTLKDIKAFVDLLLVRLEENQEEKDGYSRIIRGVMHYVEQHYMEENLSVVEIAEYMHFTSAYLNVIFKQEMKSTIKQYLSNYRLEKAKLKLEQNYEKITEIAENCGYANANYFSKVFKEAVGMTPVEYRNLKGKA